MARNSEKAQSMLFRFRASQAADLGIVDIGRQRRPKAIHTIDTIPIAERWRGQVVKEISRKTTKIQDLSLSDYQLRDLNDEINKLMNEKFRWEKQIRTLGGPNYMRGSAGPGYKYYGRANELPGVKEMHEAEARKHREQREGLKGGANDAESSRLQKLVLDAEYYGWGTREQDEQTKKELDRREKEIREQMMTDLNNRDAGKDDDEDINLPGDEEDNWRWLVPTQEEVEQELLARRKQKLLDKMGD